MADGENGERRRYYSANEPDDKERIAKSTGSSEIFLIS